MKKKHLLPQSIQPHTFRIEKIGIALAAYQPNLSHFFEQLHSIQVQTFQNFICTINLDSEMDSDGNSLLKNPLLEPFFSDSRFFWSLNTSQLGHKKNFEAAIQRLLKHSSKHSPRLSVDAIACSDQDDKWYPEKLELSRQFLQKTGPLSLIHTDMHILRDDEKLDPFTAWQQERRGVSNAKPNDLVVRNIVAGCSMLFDSRLAQKYPNIPEHIEYHDHWYAIVASYFGGVHGLNVPTFAYRQHIENVVGVTPYRGFFNLDQVHSVKSFLKKSTTCYRKSRKICRSIQDSGLPISKNTRVLFLKRFDLGIGLSLKFLLHFFNDPPLARASLARAIGKFCDIFY